MEEEEEEGPVQRREDCLALQTLTLVTEVGNVLYSTDRRVTWGHSRNGSATARGERQQGLGGVLAACNV